MNGKRFTAVSLAVVLGISVAACGKTEEPEEAGAVSVEVETPKIGELTVDTAYIGMAAPQEQVYVIPKASGTVTETFFGVGDTVQEGDVLFKIDDEAAQLQMANAQAAYESAQAGITAQNGGARDLQNFQTEEQIRQLKDSLWKTDDQIAEMEDNLGDLRDAGGSLSSAKKKAQEGADAAGTAYYAAQLELTPKIEATQNELAAQQQALEAKTQELGSLRQQEENAAEGTDLTAVREQMAKLQEEINGLTDSVTELTGTLEGLNGQLAGFKLTHDQAQAAVSQLQGQIDSVNASKTQLKSGIDQLEDGQDTIRENLNTAEQAYAITQNEIYPETDAVGSAQLHAASIGIDSAQMQLDFYTVKSPISGIVESVSVEKNGMAAAGNPAYIISNKESMTVTFQVAEKAKNVLAVGDHVVVEREGTEYDGVITEIGTMANQQTKLFQVKATVTGAGASLPNGVSVKVYATTQRESEKLVVPYDSVYFSAGNAYVYCVENNQIVKTDVTVGLMNDTEVAIEEGLTEDSLVVSNWSSKLRNGVEVEVVSMNGEEVINQTSSEEEEPQESEEAEESEEEPASDTDMTEEAE